MNDKYFNVLNMSSAYIVLWGIFVISPWTDMFALAPSLYRPMTQIVPYETFWGALAVAAGVVSSILGYKGRPTGLLIMCIVYVLFASLFFIGDLFRPSWTLFAVIAVFNFKLWGKTWKTSPTG